jgi:hypothetical protein
MTSHGRVPGSAVSIAGLAQVLLWTACLLVPGDLRAQESASSAVLPPELEDVRAALDKYRDPIVAVRDGYFSTVACVTFPVAGGDGQVPYPAGGMGVHFFNAALVGPQLDPLRPQVLIYEPEGDELKLVAAEWFVPVATGVVEAPELFGQPFDGPMEGHHPLMPALLHHYDLHVWLWKENPSGLFSPTNSDVTCPATAYTFQEAAAKLVGHP